MSILSSNLKLLREESRLSIDELAYKVDVSASDIDAFEKGTKIPNAQTLVKLCEVLRVPYEDVMDRDLTEERKLATQEMKKLYKQSSSGELDWYYGNKKDKLLFILYMIYFVLGLVISGLALWFIISNLNFEVLQEYYPEAELPLIKAQMIVNAVSWVGSVFGLGAGVFIIIDYFKSHTFVFKWWYIFFISLIFTIISIGGLVLSIPFFVKAVKKVFLKNKR